jgi:hypothetical protein
MGTHQHHHSNLTDAPWRSGSAGTRSALSGQWDSVCQPHWLPVADDNPPAIGIGTLSMTIFNRWRQHTASVGRRWRRYANRNGVVKSESMNPRWVVSPAKASRSLRNPVPRDLTGVRGVKGRKRHVLADTPGLIIAVEVTAAGERTFLWLFYGFLIVTIQPSN